MLSGNCTEALSTQANVTISCSCAKLIKNGIAPLPALLQPYWYRKRGERVRVRGHAQFYATLGLSGQGRSPTGRIYLLFQSVLRSRGTRISRFRLPFPGSLPRGQPFPRFT